MRFVRGRAEARWLPSRHHFAVFRLNALLRLRSAEPETRDAMLAVDSHQSTTESLMVGSWFFLTAACYIAEALRPRLWLPAAVLLALPLSVFLFQMIFVPAAAVFGRLSVAAGRRVDESNVDLHSTLFMLILGGVSLRHAFGPAWTRFVAWQYFFCVALNLTAACAMFLLRARASDLEEKLGGAASAN
jgi:hypothetical protein